MTVTSSGPIKLSDIAAEFGQAGDGSRNLQGYYKGGARVPVRAYTPNGVSGSGAISIEQFYGARNVNQVALANRQTIMGHGFGDEGASVAISANGDIVVTGAPHYDWGTNGSNPIYNGGNATNGNPDKGCAFVYVRSNGSYSLFQTLNPDSFIYGDGYIEYDGMGLAISGDGSTIAVGYDGMSWSTAPYGGLGVVSVYVKSGSTWVLQANLTPFSYSLIQGSLMFGAKLALSYTGDYLAVGCPGDYTGSPNNGETGTGYVFNRSGGTWSGQKIQPNNWDNVFGYAITPRIGTSISISDDGATIALGGPGDANGHGAVWIYTRSGNSWSQGQKLFPNDAVLSVYNFIVHVEIVNFGYAISLSGDGNTLIASGPGDNYTVGAVWTFRNYGGTWSQAGSKLVYGAAPLWGNPGVSTVYDGKLLAVTEFFQSGTSPTTHMFRDNSNTGNWSWYQSFTMGDGTTYWGVPAVAESSLGPPALSSDGNNIVIGNGNYNTQQWVTGVYCCCGGPVNSIRDVGQGRFFTFT